MTPAQRNALQDYVGSVTKTQTRKNGHGEMKKSRKFSSTCSSRASVASTST